ncbi:MAG: hypothetical protein K2Z81_04155 [Cyanobacteria bacterium]|nr:hypothetical protein [Cyanobacteriota bacterium]
MKLALIPLLIALANVTCQPERDVLFDAMTDELSRSVGQLKIEKYDKPFYIGYHIRDIETLSIAASYGALTEDESSRIRMLSVDVHVGDHKIDSSADAPGSFFQQFRQSGKLSLDANYDAIRHELWLATDSAYKQAVQNLEKKKATLQQQNIKERPDDWSKEKPLVLIQPEEKFTPDRNAWKTRIKDLSSTFKDYPKIRQSKVELEEQLVTRHFVNNEGSKSRVVEKVCAIIASGTAQADDGMKVSDRILVATTEEGNIPPDDQLKQKINLLAQRLTRAVEAKECEPYQGPVMFEGEAAAAFFNKVLAPNMLATRPSDSNRNANDTSQCLIGRRILPSFISVIDDPYLKDESGCRLPGGSDVDAQGVRPQSVLLVDKGKLKTLLSSRLPTLKVQNSNGHAFSECDRPQITNLVIHSDTTLDSEKMKAKLIELGKEDGLDYVLIVRASSPNMKNGIPEGLIVFAGTEYCSSNGRLLPPAVECTKVYISDGHEEPVRGVDFGACTRRILRDIVATGSDKKSFAQENGNTFIVTPSIIVKDVDVQKSGLSVEKRPELSHPYFDK